MPIMRENPNRKDFRLSLITNDPALAREAENAGIDRIGPDLEILGKENRQRKTDAQISRHTLNDIARIRSVLTKADVFVRINPVNPRSPEEIDQVVDSGAGIIMLPMSRTAAEAAHFIALVRNRAQTMLLVETPQAMMRMHEILAVDGLDEVHFGLNDLHLGLKLHSRFEVLSSDVMDALAGAAAEHNIPYGFGAVARYDDPTLPFPPDQVIGEIARLGASRTFLSRYFCPPGRETFDFPYEVRRLRDRFTYWSNAGREAQSANRRALRDSVRRYREE
ncbi:MAG: aldolase [Deltaproteobacteria bacterium]|nr:aldolase [Deltaproteobacteria bacterium]